MSDIPTTHTLPEDALRLMRTAFRMDPRSARCLEEAEAELTRLRAELAQLERESDAEISALRACLASAEADLAAAQEREQRMREALETARGLYQVTHIHAAIDAALGEPQ